MMPGGIFVTGASGFVGRHVLPGLLKLGRPVFALDRSEALDAKGTHGVTIVKGDILAPETYRAALASCSVVIHMAAATGRAPASTHHRVNARGTEILLEECRAAKVDRFLFVSSIATIFPAGIGYHYADAKREAERAVARSGLRYTILRPTVITGPGAPNLKSLEKLALLPVVVIPGNGRARVQPVQVTDVARAIVSVVEQDDFQGQVVEVGGPEVMSMETQLQRIRGERKGQPGRVLRVPLGLIRIPLAACEAIGLVHMLPVTAGQLSSFRFDGVTAEHRPRASEGVARECRVFTSYLLRRNPDAYVVDQYAGALTTLGLTPSSRFDRALLTFGAASPFLARLADAFAGLFYRTASIRRRLVLLLAILETRPPFHQDIDNAVGGSLPILFLRLTGTSAGAALSLVAGTLVVPPVCALLALMGSKPR